MKKLLIVLNAFLFLLFFSFSIRAEEPFKCASPYEFLIEKDNDFTLYDGRITLFLKSENEGFFVMSGKVQTKENHYLLSRVSYFSFAPMEINHVKKATITKVIKYPIDTTPENIWLADISPRPQKIDFPLEIWRLKDNLMLVKYMDTGYLICAKK
ncbi:MULTISPECIES: hypothetical protein [unclassified Serratia (in: enterobacteria)]|uniref:hypothetical protein n=1 Tax=unclassified Serratia (in: enterobacteria) TaxID=2647522 RepID=UPI002ED28AC2|nr:hypothetical protein [Serratia sp. C2(2)]MEE4447636.1 hypothetical protein [Serratia sp. C2(1)]